MPDPDEIFDRRRPVHGEPVEEPSFIEPRPPALTGRYVRLGRIDLDADAAELFAMRTRRRGGGAVAVHALWPVLV